MNETLKIIIVIIVMILLIMLSFIVSAVEAGFIAIDHSEIDELIEGDHKQKTKKRAKKLQSLLKNPNVFLSTIQVVNTLIAFINGALGSSTFAGPILKYWFKVSNTSNNYTLYLSITTIVMTLFVSYWQIVFGELVAKRVGMKKPAKIALFFLPLIYFFYYVLFPFIWLLNKSTSLFSRAFGVKPGDEEKQVTEIEIRRLASSAANKGGIDNVEGEMIDNIFEFSDTTVDEIMTHRTEISAVDSEISRSELIDLVSSERFTRYPVYKDTIDNIIGTIHAKDILKYLQANNKYNLKSIIRDAYFVPDSKKIDKLFAEMKNNKIHIAIVIDEYGGTAGIVTIEDLIEEILGDIYDEYDVLDKKLTKISDDEYLSDGLIELDKIDDEIDIKLPIDEYDTLSGFIISLLDRLPEKDEHIEVIYQGYKFVVLESKDKTISKVKIIKLNENDIEKEE